MPKPRPHAPASRRVPPRARVGLPTRLAARVFRPATTLMARLRFGPKFLLLGALFGLPLAILLTTYLGEMRSHLVAARSERDGLRYAAACARAIRAVQILRGRTNAARNAASGADATLARAQSEAEAAAEESLSELRAAERRDGGRFGTSRVARAEFAAWRELRANAAAMETRDLFLAYTARVKGLTALLQEVGDGSGLALDPELDSHYLSVLIIKRTMSAGEALASIRGLHVGEIARRDRDPAYERMNDWRDFDAQMVLAERAIGVAERTNPRLNPEVRRRYAAIRAGVRGLQPVRDLTEGPALARVLGVPRRPDAEAHALFAAYTRVVDDVFALDDAARFEADRLLAARLARIEAARARIVLATLLSVALAAYLTAGLYRSLRLLVARLEASASTMERGEIPVALDDRGGDELAQVAASFNRVFGRLLDLNESLNDQVLTRTAELTARNFELHESALVLAERGRALECALDGVARVDAGGKIEGLNPAFAGIFGGDPQDRLGADWLLAFDVRSHPPLLRALDNLEAAGATELRAYGLRVGPGGRETLPFAADVHLVACADERGRTTGHYVLVRDVSERVAYEERIRQLAYSDALTGLPNRASFGEALRAALAAPGPVAVMFLDLDGFKGVNDRYGHEAGDTVLRIAADRMRRSLGDAGTVARLAGDEFAVLLAPAPAEADAERLGRALIAALERPIELPRQGLSGGAARVSASVGVAFREGPRETFDTLLSRADAAMYRGKAAGKATCILATSARAA